MNRREFVTQTCMACLGGGLLSTLMTSCAPAYYVTGALDTRGITVLKSSFNYTSGNKQLTRQFIVVNQPSLDFPIYLYRISETEYSALWMQCSHQGSELQAAGDHLYCPSHGSEFNKMGTVTQGPAAENLRSFPVSITNDVILIDLRK